MSRAALTFKRTYDRAGYSVHRGKRQTPCGIVWTFERGWFGQTGDYQTGRQATRLEAGRMVSAMTVTERMRRMAGKHLSARPSCQTCKGLGLEYFADSFDRDNGQPCPECTRWAKAQGAKLIHPYPR